MKITGPQGIGITPPLRPGGRAPSRDTFSVDKGASSQKTAATPSAGGMSGVATLDALLALQAEDGLGERRKRQVRRAGRILDALDAVRLEILDGEGGQSGLIALQAAVREQREALDGDEEAPEGLKSVLNEIETRAAVELAKAQISRA